MRGIPRSHRFARSRPLTLKRRGLALSPYAVVVASLAPCHSEYNEESPSVITPSFRKFPPSHSVRGARGDAPAVPQAASIGLPAGGSSPYGASPAHIALLVRAPLR